MADILGTYDCYAWEYRPVISIIWENQNVHIKNNMEILTMGIYGNIFNNSQMKREYKDEMGSTLVIQHSYGSFGPSIDNLPTKKVGFPYYV